MWPVSKSVRNTCDVKRECETFSSDEVHGAVTEVSISGE